MFIRRKFWSQTSDNMDRWKAEQGRSREKRKIRGKKNRRERVRRKKMQMCEKGGKSRNTVFFQWFGAPEGRKVGSLKRRVRSQLARWEMKNCPPLWREAHFQVKMHKTPGVRTTFGSWDVEKVHTVVARSIFPSQNVQNTRGSDHFWKLRCRKSARRCGAKYISKSKCTKHQGFGPFLEVAMSKKCTPLWREAHFQVKMLQNTPGPDHFWQLRCRKSARRCGALSHTSHTTLSQTIFHTPSLTHPLSPTIFQTPSFTHHFVTHHLSHTIFDTPSFTHHFVTHTIFDTPSFTHHFVTHHLSHTTLSHTIFVTHHLSDTIFHTQLSHTPSFAHRHRPSCTHHFVTHHLSHIILSTPSFNTLSFPHNFVTHHLSPHHLSHTTLSHTTFHTHNFHTPSFTHNFVTHSLSHTTFTHTHTHRLSHTTLSHTHTPSFFLTHHLSHTTLSHTTLFYFSILHHLLCLSFFPRPRYNIWCSLLEEVALWGYPVL